MTSSQSSSSQQRPSSSQTASVKETADDKMVKDAFTALFLVSSSLILLKAIAASIHLYIALLPVLYFYGIQTCPSRESFDAKSELRSVLRGDNLPPDHPDKKPKGGLAGFVAGAVAALTTEVATLPGYTVEMYSVLGCAWVATVSLPVNDLECLWIGCNHRWYYWGARQLSTSSGQTRGAAAATRAPESASIQIGNTNIKFDFGKQD